MFCNNLLSRQRCFRQLLLNPQVVNYKVLTFRSILTHEKLKELGIGVSLLHDYWLKPYILPDETSKLIRRYLTQPLKPCNLRFGSKVLYRLKSLIITVTVACFLFVPYPEERGLQDINMAFPDKIREELQEECQKKQADMHAVNICVSGHDHVVITEVFHGLLNIQCSLQQVELLILINNLLCEAKTVQRLAPQAEDSLCLHITRFGYRAAG